MPIYFETQESMSAWKIWESGDYSVTRRTDIIQELIRMELMPISTGR